MSDPFGSGEYTSLFGLLSAGLPEPAEHRRYDYRGKDTDGSEFEFRLRGAIGSFNATIRGVDVSGGLTFISEEPINDLGGTVHGFRYKTYLFAQEVFLFFSRDPIRSGQYVVAAYSEGYDGFPDLVLSADRAEP